MNNYLSQIEELNSAVVRSDELLEEEIYVLIRTTQTFRFRFSIRGERFRWV